MDYTKNLSDIEAGLAARTSTIAQATGEQSALQAAKDIITNGYQSDATAIAAQVEERVNDTLIENDTLTQDNATLKSQVQTLTDENATLTTVNETIPSLNDQITSLTAQVGNIQNENTTLTTQIAKLTDILKTLGYNPDGSSITPPTTE